jgi:hypothetical protein
VTASHTDAIIAGVNKAGTTSLFVSLSTHPDITPSSIKETRFFLPPRYGKPLAAPSAWERYFSGAGDEPVRLEATPSYFYGGAKVASAMLERLENPRVILVLREPVARAVSFFTYQKIQLRFPPDLTFAEYLAEADRLGPDAFADPGNEKYMAFQGGRYADYLPEWIDAIGTERILVLDFAQLVQEQAELLRAVARWLDLDPSAFPLDEFEPENRTTGFKHATLQRVALAGNRRLERLLRRHPTAKRKLRATYYRFNGRAAEEGVSSALRDELTERYREPNAALARQLATAGMPLPGWLKDRTDQTSSG